MIKHTYDMGLVGNCAFLALIRKDTSVAWLCWPRFDSSFVFGDLLDGQKGGEFSVRPAAPGHFETHQYYLQNTNVLCTEIENKDGSYRVTDFAPRFAQYERYYKPLMLIRKLEPLSGTPRVRVACRPVGNYGETQLSRRRSSNHIAFLGLEEEIRLTTDIPLTYITDGEDFVLSETRYLVLTYGAPLEAALGSTAERFLRATTDYWLQWVKSTTISNFHQQAVIRSALALKVHQYEDTGAIIAASTTSLPEAPGSTRNWDYRYCWMRDTFYTLTAFNNIGHFEEMERYFHYIANITSKVGGDKYQPLYGISGASELTERELPLAGYLGNQPVRIGNDAYTHIQNDVYGQILVALLPLYVDARFTSAERNSPEKLVYETLRMIEKTMDQPDAGLWEFRHIAQYHCYTYLFHWAGSHAARKVAKALHNPEMEALATRLMHAAEERIERCFSEEHQAYANAISSPHLDASTLQLIMMGYLDPTTERAHRHLRALEKELMTPEGLFYRYRHPDDFGTPETTFLICSFWYVETLACVGRLDDAVREFEKLITYTNHLGLLSEDVDAKTGSQWGNFPQAYSRINYATSCKSF